MTDFEAPEPWRTIQLIDKNQALITQRLENMKEKVDKHDADIEELKKRRWPANTVSVVTTMIAVVSLFLAFAKDFIK